MPKVLADVAALKKRLDRLEEARKTRRLSGEELAAMAECSFRLAVHPSADSRRAFDLMQQAIRLDPANPKFAYHLARLLLVHGELDRAGEWLRAAQRLCPTSHRIWTHISLLQKELNDRYISKKEYEQDGLRNRAAAVLARVKEGKDQIDEPLLGLQPPRIEPHGGAKPASDLSSNGGSGAPMQKRPEPPAVIERMLDPGRCRWSGIHDLKAEDLLESAASEGWRNKLREPMEQVAALAPGRHGGHAGFVILAVEWLIAGYSPEFVRRLRPADMDPGSASASLIETACRLMEASAEELPGLLAGCLERQEIPPLLAAAIHHRRLLRPELKLDALPLAYRFARKLSAAAKPGEPPSGDAIKEHIADLKSAAKELDLAPLAPIPDFPAPREQKVCASPAEHIAQLRARAGEIQSRLDTHQARLKELLPAPKADLSQDGLIEANRIRMYVNSVSKLCQDALKEIDEIRQAGTLPSEELAGELDRVQEALRDLPARIGPFRRQLRNVPEVTVPPEPDSQAAPRGEDAAASPADRLAALKAAAAEIQAGARAHYARLKELLPTPKTELTAEIRAEAGRIRALANAIPDRCRDALGEADKLRQEGSLGSVDAVQELDRVVEDLRDVGAQLGPIRRLLQRVPEETPQSEAARPAEGLPALELELEQIDRRVFQHFDRVRATFRFYSPAALATPPMWALVRSTRTREAEALYRLGKRTEARRIWISLANEDRLDDKVLRNLAVTDTVGPDLDSRKPLSAWRAYAEMLYFHASGDFGRHSAERAAFHREFGAAYAPRCFAADQHKDGKRPESDEAEVLGFLNSPARVGLFVDHRILSLFNARMDFRSPSIVLGVRRSANAEERSRAKEKMLGFIESVEPLIPRRAAKVFCDNARKRIEWADERCKSASRIKRDSAYQDEEKTLLQWIASIVAYHHHLYQVLTLSTNLVQHLGSPEALAALCRLEAVPIDTSAQLLQTVAAGYKVDQETAVTILSRAQQSLYSRMLQLIFPAFGKRRDWNSGLGTRLYNRITGEWAGSSALPDYVARAVDRPGESIENFYPACVMEALGRGGADPEAISSLRELSVAYPASSGIAYHYAALLLAAKQTSEAVEVMKKARTNAFCEEGRKRCDSVLEQFGHGG
jgi:tetratricopeptide (TPR) repeat protein